MHSWQRTETIRLLLIVLALAAILPAGQSQQRTRRPVLRKCTVTEDEIDALVTLLEDIEQEPSEELVELDENVEAPESSGQSPQCTRELARLRKSIHDLKVSYRRLKETTETIKLQDYQTLKYRYELKKSDLTATLAGLEARINSKHRTQLKDLKLKIKELEKQLSDSVGALEQERQQNVERLISLVASQINGSKKELAANSFRKLMTYSTDPYGEIVNRVNNQWNMIEFLRKVDLDHNPIAGYEALVDFMIAGGKLHGYHALELLKHIQSILLARDGQQQQRAVALLKKFKMNAI